MRRSSVHLLAVYASRRGERAPKPIAEALNKLVEEEVAKHADGRTHNEQEESRIEKQRTLFAMLPSSNATDRLKDAMLQRAYDLMWDGFATECDALVEFLPGEDVDAMFAAWESDSDGKMPRSRFYEGT